MNAKPTFRNLNCGDLVTIDGERVRFLGFSDWNKAHSTAPVFANWSEVDECHGLKSFKELDEAEEGREYGKTIYALFATTDTDTDRAVFSLYRFKGYWALGSSADRAVLGSVEEKPRSYNQAQTLGRPYDRYR